MGWQNLLVVTLGFLCVCTDLKTGKIYNQVTYSGAVLGVAVGSCYGWEGLGASLLGFTGAFILYAILYKLKGLAAGDVKLMAAIGALKGFSFVLFSSVYILCCASLLGLIVLAWRGRLLPAVKWLGFSVVGMFIPGFQRPALEEGGTTMPFAPAIFLGTMYALWLEHANGPFTLADLWKGLLP